MPQTLSVPTPTPPSLFCLPFFRPLINSYPSYCLQTINMPINPHRLRSKLICKLSQDRYVCSNHQFWPARWGDVTNRGVVKQHFHLESMMEYPMGQLRPVVTDWGKFVTTPQGHYNKSLRLCWRERIHYCRSSSGSITLSKSTRKRWLHGLLHDCTEALLMKISRHAEIGTS